MRFEVPPGATPIDDTDGLIPDDVVTTRALWIAEAETILEAHARHLKRRHDPGRRWLTEALVRSVHRDMFGKVWRWAGTYRQRELNIGVAPYRVIEEVGRLCADIVAWDRATDAAMPVIERAARIHHRLAWIHPFKNGNGRHARTMADMYLHAHRQPLPLWPEESLASETPEREAYLRAIRAADAHDFRPLTALIEKYS